jgi:hypothetical protein
MVAIVGGTKEELADSIATRAPCQLNIGEELRETIHVTYSGEARG